MKKMTYREAALKKHKLYSQNGEDNPNWKGGISKDYYRYKKRYVDKYPEKNRARWKYYRAIKSGKLKRGKCEVCGKENTHGHHKDYSKPLDVIWLCPKHHRIKHGAKR